MRDLIGLLPKINITLLPSDPAPGSAPDPGQGQGQAPASASDPASALASDPASAPAPASDPASDKKEEKEKIITVSSISELWQHIYEAQKEEENNKKSKDSAIVMDKPAQQPQEEEGQEKKGKKIQSFVINDENTQDKKVVNLYKIGDSFTVGFTTTANNNKKQESEPSLIKQGVGNFKDKFSEEKNNFGKNRHYDKIAALKYNFSEDVDVLFSDSQYQEKESEKARKVIDVVMKEDAYFNVAYISLPNGYRAKAIMGRGTEEYIDGEKKYLEKGQVYLCDKLEKKNDKGVFQTVNSREADKIKEDHDIRVIGVKVKESSQAQENQQDSASLTNSADIRRSSLNDIPIGNTGQDQRRGSVDNIQPSDVEQDQRRGSVDDSNSLTNNQASESLQTQPNGQAPESSQTVEITSMSIRCRGKTIAQQSEKEKSEPSTIVKASSCFPLSREKTSTPPR